MAVESGTFVTPGQRLGLAEQFEAGAGTSTQGLFLCASIVGSTHIIAPEDNDANDQQKPRLSILRAGTSPVIPSTGDLVICRVLKVLPRVSNVEILAVGTTPVAERFSAILRQQDVRATEIDKVQMHLCFRPGDLIRAEVLSLGDSRAYFVHTARDDLGVIQAKGASGKPMTIVGKEDMKCPETEITEKRKIAQQITTTKA